MFNQYINREISVAGVSKHSEEERREVSAQAQTCSFVLKNYAKSWILKENYLMTWRQT